MLVALYVSILALIVFGAMTYNERSKSRHGRFDRAMRIGR